MNEMPSDWEAVLSAYFNEIAACEPLSRQREVELAARIQHGDWMARNELVQANLRFVIEVAKTYQNRGLPLADLIGAGNVGLITAAERFDGDRGFKFITYAVWWIKQAIMMALAECSRMVRLPRTRQDLLRQISRSKQRLVQANAADTSYRTVAADLDLSSTEIDEILLTSRPAVSLDENWEDDDQLKLTNLLADADQEAPDESVVRRSTREQLQRALGSIGEVERRILTLYYGLEGKEPSTLKQIGDSMGLSRERVRQIKERALNRLRHPSRFSALLDDN